MEQTLHGCPGCSGDRVLVNKVVYRFHDPRPGDIVVFKGPESWAPETAFQQPTNPVAKALRAVASTFGVATPGEKDFVKRVIAVGGQTVQCCDEEGRVTVDGRALDEPYVYSTDPKFDEQPFGPVTVPAGQLWVMGDHRDESADSRAHVNDADKGTIPVDNVIGKAFVIIWPVDRWATLGTPSDFGGDGQRAPYTLPLLIAIPVVLVLGIGLTTTRRRRRRAR
jgi:signal peptidase I